jgi:hypothetical protein
MFEINIHLTDTMKTMINWGAASVTIASLMAWLPSLAALLAVIWWGFRIYELKTIQRWLGKEQHGAEREL